MVLSIKLHACNFVALAKHPFDKLPWRSVSKGDGGTGVDDAVSVRELTVAYGENVAIQGVSFDIKPGGIVGIIGPNGAGKTTLMKAMLGLLPMERGAVKFFGEGLNRQRKRIAYVPQRNIIDWDFPIDVLETVLLGTYPHLGLFRRPGREEQAWARECLARVGMEQYASRQIGALSGGQQQRVFIARALAQRAHLFFLDEPFVGIDASSESIIVDLLHRLRDEGKTLLVVQHDLSKVHDYFDNVLLINKELVGYGPPEQVFTPEVLETVFAAQMPLFRQLGVLT